MELWIWGLVIVVAVISLLTGITLGVRGEAKIDTVEAIQQGMDRVIAVTTLVMVEHPDEFDRDKFFDYVNEAAADPAKRLQIAALVMQGRVDRGKV